MFVRVGRIQRIIIFIVSPPDLVPLGLLHIRLGIVNFTVPLGGGYQDSIWSITKSVTLYWSVDGDE